jgi:folate-binding protein YgfZ
MTLREFHQSLGARFEQVRGGEVVAGYGDAMAEHAALRATAAVLDFSFRGRLCLAGADRVEFLHGQVTNDIKSLAPGDGCYNALVTAKGRMVGDANAWRLADELLLDLEPGCAAVVAARFEKFIVAADVQVLDAAPHFGLLTVQGPRAPDAVRSLALPGDVPPQPWRSIAVDHDTLGRIYMMNLPRTGTAGFDFFVPVASLAAVADKLIAAARAVGGRAAGWQAFEWARVEAGIPRFGADMDDTTLPPEAGIEARAVSYSKGCYVGQEVIARIRTYGQVMRKLCGLRLPDGLASLPARGDKLFKDGKEAGFITTAIASPALRANVALGCVRREVVQAGGDLTLQSADGAVAVRIVELPFAEA